MAVLDSGIDYTLPDFRNSAGSRILYLWDQSLIPDAEKGFLPPEGFSSGVEFTQEQINQALEAGEREGFQLVPSIDVSGHGTAVAAIAAGSNTNARYTGPAPGASLLIVKLGQAGSGSLSADHAADAGDHLRSGKGTGAGDASGGESEFWKQLWRA